MAQSGNGLLYKYSEITSGSAIDEGLGVGHDDVAKRLCDRLQRAAAVIDADGHRTVFVSRDPFDERVLHTSIPQVVIESMAEAVECLLGLVMPCLVLYRPNHFDGAWPSFPRTASSSGNRRSAPVLRTASTCCTSPSSIRAGCNVRMRPLLEFFRFWPSRLSPTRMSSGVTNRVPTPVTKRWQDLLPQLRFRYLIP